MYEGDAPAPMALMHQRRNSSYISNRHDALREGGIIASTQRLVPWGSLRPVSGSVSVGALKSRTA